MVATTTVSMINNKNRVAMRSRCNCCFLGQNHVSLVHQLSYRAFNKNMITAWSKIKTRAYTCRETTLTCRDAFAVFNKQFVVQNAMEWDSIHEHEGSWIIGKYSLEVVIMLQNYLPLIGSIYTIRTVRTMCLLQITLVSCCRCDEYRCTSRNSNYAAAIYAFWLQSCLWT